MRFYRIFIMLINNPAFEPGIEPAARMRRLVGGQVAGRGEYTVAQSADGAQRAGMLLKKSTMSCEAGKSGATLPMRSEDRY